MIKAASALIIGFVLASMVGIAMSQAQVCVGPLCVGGQPYGGYGYGYDARRDYNDNRYRRDFEGPRFNDQRRGHDLRFDRGRRDFRR